METAKNKVIRYHGSSSGYYIVGNILSGQQTNKQDETATTATKKLPSHKHKHKHTQVPLLPTYNGTYRLRKLNKFDEDMVFIRDATEAEHACQREVDKQDTIDDLVPRSVLRALAQMDDDPLFKNAGMERDVIFSTLLEKSAKLVRKEYLVPRIANIQALILLCAHPTYSGNTHRCWIMAGMAVRMAQDLGLHRTFSSTKISEEMDYVLFVNFVKLSGILGEVLRRIYSPKAKSVGYKTASMEQTAYSLQRMLNEWFDQLPEQYRITCEDLEGIKKQKYSNNINGGNGAGNYHYSGPKNLYDGGCITACYCAVVILLHRPFIALENSDGAKAQVYAEAMQRCTKMAKITIDIARVLPSIAITRFGWNFAAYSIYQAVLIHIYNCMSNDPKVESLACEYIRISMEECVGPLTRDIPYGPPIISLLTKLMSIV
ncbi:hypothetical protein J3Q64DRAFT_1640524, partial [Phycomyces blakesleeanus]